MTIFIIIMTISGFFGGLINFIQTYKENSNNTLLFWKCIIVGIGASFLVPLFLQTISSAIITTAEENTKDYLIFGGFCLIASIFSKRFIETLGEKILQKAEDAEKKAEEANGKANALEIEVEKQSAEVDSLVAKSTEIDDLGENEADEKESMILADIRQSFKSDDVVDKTKSLLSVIQALKNNSFTFRTVSGIAKETGITESRTQEILDACIQKKLIRQIKNGSKILYALTTEGINFDKRLTEFNQEN